MLSGWARVAGTQSEAELMAAAWRGAARELVVDPDARTTVGNAFNALNDIRRTGAREVVVVTSRWHAARAKAAFRLLLWKRHVRVSAAFPPEPAKLGRDDARAAAVGVAAGTALARATIPSPDDRAEAGVRLQPHALDGAYATST